MSEERLQPVTFGSIIYLSTESSLDSFMFCDGFMENSVVLRSFHSIGEECKSHHDFSFCLFMVLPFANASCFDMQRQMIASWREKLVENGMLKLEERKNQVAELKNRLVSELQFNIGTLQKSKGSNICFGSSNFMLLHINSLKYLCLTQDDNNNLFLELTNDAGGNCFFNFDPSLKLQRGRSDNFVYEDEIVYLSCTEKFSGKSPYLCIRDQLIVGAIDEKENWKVNIYEEPFDEAESRFMRLGSCVWILLSEKLFFLSGNRQQDPFQELYDFQHNHAYKGYMGRMKQAGKNKAQVQLSRLEALHYNKKDCNFADGFLEDPRAHLYDDMRLKVELTEISEASDKVGGESEELSSFGLWKIEALNVKKGGVLRWEDHCRLKHVVTGMYLSVELDTADKWRVRLVQNKIPKQEQIDFTVFEFVSIENLILYENNPQTKGIIQKDAYFMIRNVQSQLWLGFQDSAEEMNSKAPVLFDYVKDVNTFRFREAAFQCIWENYALISSFPVLFETVRCSMDTSKTVLESTLRKETQDKKHSFDECFPKTLFILEFFQDFLLNRILSNINLEQEIFYPSDIRQTKFQQQFLLGLVCWLLIQVFPSFEEFEKLQVSPQVESLLLLQNPQLASKMKTLIKKRKGVKQQKNISYTFKVFQEHLLKKYKICEQAYMVLQAACFQNPSNQDFVHRFIKRLSVHFGFGEFVSDTFQIIFKDNFKILHSIHRERFHSRSDEGADVNEHVFQVITGKLKLFEPYYKLEILELLGAFTQIGTSSIYINQEKVFASIVENKNFLFGHLLKIIYHQEEGLLIEYRVFREKEYEAEAVELRNFVRQFDNTVMLQYFKAQLRLYALLCQNRNYACVKNMRELLPQQVLLRYLSSRDLPDDIRAIICFMLMNLYVDKEPRTTISKPNFVRVFKPPVTHHTWTDDLNPMHLLHHKHKSHQVQPHDHHHHHHHKTAQDNQEKDDDITNRFIEINLSDDINGAQEIRQWLLNFLEERTKKVDEVQEGKLTTDVTHEVYNQLTFEVVRTLSMMVKFGLFTKYATKLMNIAQQEKNKAAEPEQQEKASLLGGLNPFHHKHQQEIDHLEKLVQMLATLLEFDYNYVRELQKHDFKRTYIELQKAKAQDLFGLGANLFTSAPQEEPQEEEKATKKKAEEQEEYQTYQFLKRYQSLLNIIKKFTNKTFTNKEFKIQVRDDYQVLIKREICNVFDNLLEWRADYFMENLIQYFQKYYSAFKQEGEIVRQSFNNASLKTLMPDLLTDPGVGVRDKETRFIPQVQREEVRDFDIILNRPFVETLLLTFYFSTDPLLQNSLANLIFKLYSQRERLLRNIGKVSLVEGDEGNQSYTKLSRLMNKLKGLISYSQSWLQIIEQNSYDEKAEETLLATQKKLRKLYIVFKEKVSTNREAFIIKQKVFKHLGGHKIILKFIEQGTTVIDSKIDYFKEDQDTTQFSYKNQFIQTVKNTFNLSHQILATFVEDNPPNQKSIYKHYGKLLINSVNINIGQVEFIQDLFRNNSILCYEPQSLYFNFIVGLIKDHGQHQQFLEVFTVFLEVAKHRPDNIEIQKAILSTLFSEENVSYVNPLEKAKRSKKLPDFYPEPSSLHYKSKFINIVCECLKSDVSINYVVKANHKLSVPILLRWLIEDQSVQVCEILHTFLSKLDSAIDQFKVGASDFITVLEQQINKIKTRKMSNDERNFVGVHIVGLLNTYFEYFLKDIGMIALKMLSRDKDVQKEKKVFEFAQVLSDNLDVIMGRGDVNADVITNLAKMAKNFNVAIPEEYTEVQLALQEEHQATLFSEENEYLNHNNGPELKGKLSTRVHRKMRAAIDLISMTKTISKNHQERNEFLEIWQSFVGMLQESSHIKESLKEERMKFPRVIMNIAEMFEGQDDIRLREMLISSDDVIVMLLNYIQYWKAKGANRNTIIFILKAIRSLVLVNSPNDEGAMVKHQNHLDNLNATTIALKLYWKDKHTEDQYIYQLIKFVIQLLHGGNKTIQSSILTLFKVNPDSEAFFRKIYNVLTEEMNAIKKSIKISHQMTQRKFIEKTLRVIQLLCEGHNTDLQDYLRQQTNSKISYDLVSLMVKLVITHKISNATYPSVIQCLETLTEVVQGPCKENQMVIVTSKFLEWSIDLLREEEKLFDMIVKNPFGIENKSPSPSPSPFMASGSEPGPSAKYKLFEGSADEIIEQQSPNQKPEINLHRGLLMRLKYKCTVTLLSLLEMQETNEEIVNRMIRSIPVSVLASELARVHDIYKKNFGEDYVIEAFQRYEQPLSEEDNDDPKEQLVIEYGFNIFILANILILRNKKPQEAELEEIAQIVQEFQFVKEKQDDGLLGGLDLLGDLMGGLDALKNLASFGNDAEAQSELQKQLERRKQQKAAFEFFAKNTVFLEFVRDEEIQKMYFPLLPQCKMLPKEAKLAFHENVDHSSTRDKLAALLEEAEHMIEVMEHEENLRRLFKTSKLLELIANHKSLWENLAFISNIVVNITIIASFSEYVYTRQLQDGEEIEDEELFRARLYEPRFWYQSQFDWTDTMIQIMGIICLCFSSLVVSFFFLKKAPLLLKDIWIHFWNAELGFFSKSLLFCKSVVQSFIACCTDFDFVYYSAFMSCLILGLVIHPFLFIFLLADFLRIATLKIVVKAIWISKGAMGLSFLVFLLVEYYFTIIGYLYYSDQYQDGQCDVMWKCFLVTFDQTFKNGGAIGDYLTDQTFEYGEGEDEGQYPINYERDLDQQNRFVYRFIFDNLFKFLLVILIINMVSGIIIDTFGALKDSMLEKERNLTEFCFVCGIEREKLDKSAPFGYYSHIKKDHYMWNYVFYKAYLLFKRKTEYSGNETYIVRQLANNDIDWFPIKRAIGVVDDDEEEDDSAKITLMQEIEIEIPEVEQLANKVCQKVKMLFEKG